jgi:hypothetical protein
MLRPDGIPTLTLVRWPAGSRLARRHPGHPDLLQHPLRACLRAGQAGVAALDRPGHGRRLAGRPHRPARLARRGPAAAQRPGGHLAPAAGAARSGAGTGLRPGDAILHRPARQLGRLLPAFAGDVHNPVLHRHLRHDGRRHPHPAAGAPRCQHGHRRQHPRRPLRVCYNTSATIPCPGAATCRIASPATWATPFSSLPI